MIKALRDSGLRRQDYDLKPLIFDRYQTNYHGKSSLSAVNRGTLYQKMTLQGLYSSHSTHVNH